MEYANVDLQALEDLQAELRKISAVLKDYSDKMNSALMLTSSEWQDSRFEEFADDFTRHRTEVEAISESYITWANGYLNTIIEKVKAYNNR